MVRLLSGYHGLFSYVLLRAGEARKLPCRRPREVLWRVGNRQVPSLCLSWNNAVDAYSTPGSLPDNQIGRGT